MYSDFFGTVLFVLLLACAIALVAWIVVEEIRSTAAQGTRRVTAVICIGLLVAAFALQVWPLKASTEALCGFFPVSDVFGPTGNPQLVVDAPNPTDAESQHSCITRGRTVFFVSSGLIALSVATYWGLGRSSWRSRNLATGSRV